MDRLLNLPPSLRRSNNAHDEPHFTAQQKLGATFITITVFTILYPDFAIEFLNMLVIGCGLFFLCLVLWHAWREGWAWWYGTEEKAEDEDRGRTRERMAGVGGGLRNRYPRYLHNGMRWREGHGEDYERSSSEEGGGGEGPRANIAVRDFYVD